MENELCPYCGKSKVKVVTKRTKTGYYGDGEPAYYVTAYATCKCCHSRGPVVSAERIPSSNTYGLDVFDKEFYFKRKKLLDAEYAELEQKALDAWNRRTEPENKKQQLCADNENFIQNKFGYCFYSLGPCPLIYNLYVHPQYRRKGYSSELLRQAIREIRKSGYRDKIYIQAEPKENSISKEKLTQYYEERGLVIYGDCKPEATNA